MRIGPGTWALAHRLVDLESGDPGVFGPPGVNGAINVTLGGGAGPLVFTSPPTQGLSTANSLVQFQLHFDWDNDDRDHHHQRHLQHIGL